MLVHLAVPLGQKRQGALAQAFGRALRGSLAREPQIRANQGQDVARGGRDGIKLRFDETVACMHLAGGH